MCISMVTIPVENTKSKAFGNQGSKLIMAKRVYVKKIMFILNERTSFTLSYVHLRSSKVSFMRHNS